MDATTPATHLLGTLTVTRPTVDTLCVRLAGQWTIHAALPSTAEVQAQCADAPRVRRLSFEASDLADWDSALALLTFLLTKGAGGAMEILNADPRIPTDVLVALIERGLRAQLQTDSLVTGLLFIQLDLPPATSPEAAPREATIDSATKLLEIPTVPTTLQEVSNTIRQVLDKLAELPLEEMLRSFEGTLLGINRLVNAPEVLEAFHNMNVTLTGMQQVLQLADTQVTRVASSATAAFESLNKAATDIHQLMQQTQQLVQHVDKQLGQVTAGAVTTLGQVGKLTQTVHTQTLALATSLSQTATGALQAIERLRETLTAAQQFVTPSAPVGYELVKTLREFSETARSLRMLANYLERHPNALVFGRQESGAK